MPAAMMRRPAYGGGGRAENEGDSAEEGHPYPSENPSTAEKWKRLALKVHKPRSWAAARLAAQRCRNSGEGSTLRGETKRLKIWGIEVHGIRR